jgi:phytoene desaturase
MKKNLGLEDRLVRFVLAIVVGLSIIVVDSVFIKLILAASSLFILYESLASWCVLYALLGKNSCPIQYPSTPAKKGKVVIVGAGPGGLSAGMILASKGYDVMLLEKEKVVGGRNAPLKLGDFTFEVGPTFIILPQVFKEVFELADRKIEDYLDFKKLDPMYRLRFFDGRDFFVHDNKDELKAEIAKLFPGEEIGYERWFVKHKEKFEKTYACLSVPYLHFYNYFRFKLLRAIPVMQLTKSVSGVLDGYFKTKEMKMASGFQAKYLGMSPWRCPGAFSILSYAEHGYGIYHAIGGVYKISEKMAEVIGEYGGEIKLNTTVKSLITKNGKTQGVVLSDGSKIKADHVIMNADFAYAMTSLVKESSRPSYPDKKIEKMKYSCSTFMLYLGLDKQYDIPHHNIFFGKDYKKNVDQIFGNKGMPDDPAFYIQNPVAIDKTLAPKGKSSLYVLVPVSNTISGFSWEKKKHELRDLIMELIKERTELKDIDEHIEVEKIIHPGDWSSDFNVHHGAVFNLSHSLDQMLYLRPHNRFNDIDNLYLVGGGTHPGSGLPTILESGRIAADLIMSSK